MILETTEALGLLHDIWEIVIIYFKLLGLVKIEILKLFYDLNLVLSPHFNFWKYNILNCTVSNRSFKNLEKSRFFGPLTDHIIYVTWISKNKGL